MALLSLHKIDMGFADKTEILHALSLDIAEGQRLAIVGGNGSGKSTLLRIIAGLMKPTFGTVTYHGRSQPALLFQNPRQQLICANVREEIRYSLQIQGHDYVAADTRTDELLAEFNLEAIQNNPPAELSGGQQQKVALAALLTRTPDLLLLDEPEAFLDGHSRAEFRDFFARSVNSVATVWTCCRMSEVPSGFDTSLLVDGRLHEIAIAHG